MKLPNFREFLPSKPKETPKEYFLALQIGKTVSKAAVWEGDTDIVIKKVATADTPTKAIEEVSPEFPTLTKVVFGLPQEYVSDNKIKESHLPELKRIAADAHLKPIGFVVIPEAVAHYLEKDTNTPQTCILLGVEDHKLTFSLFRIGKCIKIIEIVRTETLFTDIEKGLATFDQEEILPSKLVLYNGSKNLDEIKEQLLSYPWQKNEKFLHVPKIEALSAEFSIQAIVFAGVSENQEDTGLNQTDAPLPESAAGHTDDKTPAPETPEELEAVSETTTKNIESDGDDLEIHDSPFTTSSAAPQESFGFSVRHDDPSVASTTNFEPRAPIHADNPRPKLPLLGNVKLPTLALPASIAIPRMRALVPISAIILLIGGFFVYAFYFYPQATIALIAEPNVIDNEIKITLNTNIASVDVTNKEIPGKVYSASITGDTTNATSGKKTIGDKATGEVLVYNKTSQSKTLARGTVLGASSTVTFTLDSDVTVASASDTGESLTYGKEKVKVIATKIGPNGNVKKDTEFSIGNESKNAVSAKNDSDFGGGSERQVSVASKEDQDNLIKTLTKNLAEQGRQKLQEQLGSGEQFLDESLKSNIADKKFDKNVGDETDNLALNLTLEFSQIAYNQEHLNKFFEEYMKEQISDQYEFDPSKSRFDVKKVEQDSDGKITFLANYHAYLLPKIDVSPFAKEFAGLSKSKLEERVLGMKDQKIVGYDVSYRRQLPFMKTKLPLNAKNIEVKVVPY